MKNIVYYKICKLSEHNNETFDIPQPIIDHIRKYHGFDDTMRSIIAYSEINKILEKRTSFTWNDITFSNTGKPHLKEGFISASHSNNLIIVAYSNVQIGLDIEKIGTASKAIYSKVFKKEELENVNNEDFFRRWTLLEAKAKLTDSSIFNLNDIDKYSCYYKKIVDKDTNYSMSILIDADEYEILEL